MQKTIVVSAFLSGKGQEKKVAYFERLDSYMRQFKYKLYLVNVGPIFFKTPCEHISIPACVTLASKINGYRFLQEDYLSPELIEAAGVEAEIRNSNLLTSAVKILFFRAFMRKILIERQPCLCVIWHQFNGLSRGLVYLCKELDIPYVFAEYGSLPGTVVFEKNGQMAESWVAQRNEEFLNLPVDKHDLEMAEYFLKFIRDNKRTRKEQSNDVSLDKIVEKCRKVERKIIFYAGQNDPQTGMVPSCLPEARTHSPFFVDTFDALNHLIRLAEKNNWHILFKPHPLLQEKHNNLQPVRTDHVDFVVGANIFDCMAKSNVTVTILSQVSYLALIHGHPTLLLGRNQLSGKGCVYEVTSFHEIEGVIQQAMQDGITEEKKRIWLRHVAQLCKYYLFSFEKDIDKIIGRSIDDAARFLLLECGRRVKVSSNSQHGNRNPRGSFGNDLSRWHHLFKIRFLYRLLCFFDIPLRQLQKEKTQKISRIVLLCMKELVRKAYCRITL
jgi:hypothetical protein